ncbi:hypothetical protein GCM10009678_89700 [Actinomadura kijaniata]|uniref:Uncharacterized protein n=1 Tax=Actinomadura namibiensis TaxID=182080 RepID=A0A7W3LW98_ACTNM|nr:hypothetical protein [Actinomadura namibiensis]MBA8955432.1 hypothetical protein [Actinomadura namibiensis]
MSIVLKRAKNPPRSRVPADVSAEQLARLSEARVRQIRAEAEAQRQIRAAELADERERRRLAEEDRRRAKIARRRERAEKAAAGAALAQRLRTRLVLVAPILLVNALAVGGQIGFATERLHWNLAQALVFAGALESVAIYIQWHAHEARLAGDAVARLTAASYGVALLVSGINYEHYTEHWQVPNTKAVTFGLMSLLSPWLWGMHSRRQHRDRLREAGLVDRRTAHFSGARWLHFPFRTLGALRWAVAHGVQDPAAAWVGYAAQRRDGDAPRPLPRAEPATEPAGPVTGPAAEEAPPVWGAAPVALFVPASAVPGRLALAPGKPEAAGPKRPDRRDRVQEQPLKAATAS